MSDDSKSGPAGGGDEADDPGLLARDIVKRWDPDRLLRSVSSKAGKGQQLDYATRSRFERRLAADLSTVRVYTGEFAEQVAAAHNAEAVTIGNTGMIMMRGSSYFSSISSAGSSLLAHELTHVAQATRDVHRAASFGSAQTLATEEHEEEAEAVELEELTGGASSGGSAGAAAAAGAAEGEEKKKKKEQVLRRVIELMDE